MRPARLGAVSYLNTRPLVRGLDERPDLFTVRFDVPSVCASLLHEGAVDVGLIPAVEYLRGEYRIVPGIAIASDGPVDSVAIFTTVPIERVRTLALDVSSKTSVALTRILCRKLWDIAPEFVPAEPDLRAMLGRADAALVIGDPALEIDPEHYGTTKIDLGLAWQALTGLPFVYAAWVGPAGAVDCGQVAALQAARARGEREVDAIGRETAPGDPAAAQRVVAYLRDTLRYGLGDRECAGLERFHALAVELDLAAAARPLTFFS